MKELTECIKANTVNNVDEIQSCILNMVCPKDSPIPLAEKDLIDALGRNGEYLILKLSYDDYEDEIKNEVLKYKSSQALSMITSYEDDGSCFGDIEKFVKYLNTISDEKQNCTFGVKHVDKLSKFPITILFSAILPINQLKMTIGKSIHDLIHSDDEYFIPRFKKQRDVISDAIGIPLLPLLPILDEELNDLEVRLVDLVDGRLISEFKVCKNVDKDTVEIYLEKLLYIYTVLAKEKKYF